MDKPISMPLKSYLYKVMSIKHNLPSSIIETIVNHQFSSLREAMLTSNSIEISGFCKFNFNTKKAQKKLEKNLSKKVLFESLLEKEESEKKKASLQLKLDISNKEIEFLKTKLNEL